MTGDKLLIDPGLIKASGELFRLLFPVIRASKKIFVITIAGESGSGKSEIAVVLSRFFSQEGIKNIVLQQDDYFYYPPTTNASKRRQDISRVGPSEVNLALLDENLKDILDGKNEIKKPLVLFQADRITEERISLAGLHVVLVDGTYTTTLKNAHRRIFINRTYHDTREARKKRGREIQDEFLERILQIEHEIIATHKSKADLIVTKKHKVRQSNAGRE